MSQTPGRVTPNQWAILAIILIAALALRLHNLGAQSFWFDELQSMQSATGHGWVQEKLPTCKWIDPALRLGQLNDAAPWWRVWTSLDVEVLPPLYYMVLRIWRDIVGDSEGAIRLLSVIFSVGAVGLIFACGRMLFGTIPALWAAALMAIATPQVTYAQEARSYAMATFLTLATLWSALKLVQKPSIARIVVLSLCATATMLTHYFAAGPIAAIFVYAMIRLDRRLRFRALLSFGTAAIVYAVIWGPFLIEQRKNFHRDALAFADTKSDHMLSALTEAGEAPLRQLIGDSTNSPIISALVFTGLIATLILLRIRPALLLAQLWIICSLGVLLMIDLATNTTVISLLRYTTLCAPGVFLLVAGAADVNKFSRHLIPLLVVIFCARGAPHAYDSWKGDWRALGRNLAERAKPGEPVVFARSGLGWTPGGKYLDLSFYDARWNQPIVLFNEGDLLPADVVARLQRSPVVWVVTDHPGVAPDTIIPSLSSDDRDFQEKAAAVWRATWKDNGPK